MRKLLSYIPMLAMVLIIGCDTTAGEKSIEAYYPLKEGMRWVFKQEVFQSDKLYEENKVIYTNLPEQEFNGRKVVPRKRRISTASIFHSDKIIFVGKDERGFFNVGTRDLNPDQSVGNQQIFSPPLYFIKTPLIVNKTWSYEEKGFIAEYTIESLNEDVTTFMRTFKDCIRIKVKVLRGSELFRVITSWYAPRVGLVKFHSKEIKGDRQYIETLESFEKIGQS